MQSGCASSYFDGSLAIKGLASGTVVKIGDAGVAGATVRPLLSLPGGYTAIDALAF